MVVDNTAGLVSLANNFPPQEKKMSIICHTAQKEAFCLGAKDVFLKRENQGGFSTVK